MPQVISRFDNPRELIEIDLKKDNYFYQLHADWIVSLDLDFKMELGNRLLLSNIFSIDRIARLLPFIWKLAFTESVCKIYAILESFCIDIFSNFNSWQNTQFRWLFTTSSFGKGPSEPVIVKKSHEPFPIAILGLTFTSSIC